MALILSAEQPVNVCCVEPGTVIKTAVVMTTIFERLRNDEPSHGTNNQNGPTLKSFGSYY